VLVVDDRREMAEMLADGLEDQGFSAVACASSPEAARLLEQEGFDALVTDLRMPGMDGLELLAASRLLRPDRPVLVMTAYGAVDTAIESIRRGAFHYLTKPFKLEEMVLFLRRALDQTRLAREASALRRERRAWSPHPALLGVSRAMQRVTDAVRQIARTTTPVLILGETGTGKNVAAQAIHDESDRAGGPFVSVNCAALPEALLESELFGHVKGAFTGADAPRPGLFVEADGGTLLLDEIGDLPLVLQSKLLHVLERGAVRPVGSARERPVQVRLLAATHRDLRERVRQGLFREDLLYRLDVVALELPPLRTRREDIPPLVEHFLRLYRQRHPDAPGRRLRPEAMAQMMNHPWPGNVRELSHVIERLIVLSSGEEMDLSLAPRLAEATLPAALGDRDILPLREVQRRYARWAFARLGKNRLRTAERLGIDPKTLSKLVNDEADDGEKDER
jgi:two-component system response regulator HydG